jgi:GNAT superfamily N-acetyltransferase
MPVIRSEPPSGAASQALFQEYMALVRERLGAEFVPTERIFASVEDFDGHGSAWLVVYEDDRAVACGGLRLLRADIAEIKRMFVTARARGQGHARLLLSELEERARAAGCERVRLLTTEVLREARTLYRSVGYRPIGVATVEGRVELWLEKRLGRM